MTITKIMAMVAARVTVGGHEKEWGSDNASTTIPLTMMKTTITARKKEGGWDPSPPW